MLNAVKILILLMLLFVITTVVLVVDFSPTISNNSGQQVGSADSVQPLIDELRRSLRSRYDAQQINVSKEQATSLAGFVSRAIKQVNAQVVFTNRQIEIGVSYEIKTGIKPIYLNLLAIVQEGNGLQLNKLKIGDLSLPGGLALKLAEFAANSYTQSEVATKALATVQTVNVDPTGASILLAPIDGLLREFTNIKTGGSREDTKVLKIRIAHYLRVLDSLHLPTASGRNKTTSLSYYLHAVMKEASVLSKQSSVTLENEAAILALAIYAGSGRFTTLIGDISFAIDSVPTASPKPDLLKRKDLSLHFIFSAAIKLLSQKGVSIAVGEFKELMDRGKGGSGYSFVDLAADLSGAHFAELAVNPATARRLQRVMASSPNEYLFMVPIDGLEEGLSKAQFEAKYGAVDSELYLKVVAEINARIQVLPITR